METPTQLCARLAVALDDLAGQEAVCIAMRDFGAVKELQARAAPLVDTLTLHAPQVTDAAVRQRIAAVIRRREESIAQIGAELERTRGELAALQSKQRRVAKVAPVYGTPAAPRHRLSAIG
jgi:hypothetical protein